MKRGALGNCICLLSLPSHFSPSLFLFPLIFFFPLSPAFLESPDLTDSMQHSPLHASILLPVLLAQLEPAVLSSAHPLTCHRSLSGGKNKRSYSNPTAKLFSCNPCLECSLNQSAVTCKSTHMPVRFVSRNTKSPSASINKPQSSEQHQLQAYIKLALQLACSSSRSAWILFECYSNTDS